MNGRPLEALSLVAVTVLIHGLGSVLIVWTLALYEPWLEGRFRLFRSLVGLIHLVVSLVILHLLEVVAWASFYFMQGLFPDLRTSIYFSLVTYTTVGYGDVVLPEAWKLLGGCEALAGILMTAWSTAILIPAVSRIHQEQYQTARRRGRKDKHHAAVLPRPAAEE
jgi:hypothetical protein